MKNFLPTKKNYALFTVAAFFVASFFLLAKDYINENILGISHKGDYLVTKVIDGDTIELEDGRKVRYIGIDTPETVDPYRPQGCFGNQAKKMNEKLVLEKYVRLEKDVSEIDKFGRLLRYIYVGDTFVNEYLVKKGYANSTSFPPDIKYQELFREAELYARLNNLGLWKECSN